MRWPLRATVIPHRAKRFKQRTAKSCGPGAATLASIPAGPCWRGNGDNKGRSPGRARISRKPTSAGKAGMSWLYLSNPCAFYSTFSTRCCGRSRRPAFPAPSLRQRGRKERPNPGQTMPREREPVSAVFASGGRMLSSLKRFQGEVGQFRCPEVPIPQLLEYSLQ